MICYTFDLGSLASCELGILSLFSIFTEIWSRSYLLFLEIFILVTFWGKVWSWVLFRYELFVGQPPFYTNSVYALIRHIIKVHLLKNLVLYLGLNERNQFIYKSSFQDPVKYPENMSSNFKSFLRGLLNKVSTLKSSAKLFNISFMFR